MSNISAMSYKFFSSAAVLFHIKFYISSFIEILPFSEAACHARRTLRNNQKRWGLDNESLDIQDWLVPVVYSTNDNLQIISEPITPIQSLTVQAKMAAMCMEALAIVFVYLYSNLLRCLFPFIIPSLSD